MRCGIVAAAREGGREARGEPERPVGPRHPGVPDPDRQRAPRNPAHRVHRAPHDAAMAAVLGGPGDLPPAHDRRHEHPSPRPVPFPLRRARSASARSRRRYPGQKWEGDSIAHYWLEYGDGFFASGLDDGSTWTRDYGIRFRFTGTDGVLKGTIGWPDATYSTLQFTSRQMRAWHEPVFETKWFPDAFIGTMGDLFRAIETGRRADHQRGGQPEDAAARLRMLPVRRRAPGRQSPRNRRRGLKATEIGIGFEPLHPATPHVEHIPESAVVWLD